MDHGDGFWKLEHLSDAQLLEGLGGVLRTQRRALAELVAHLGEVEDRRLHLVAAHSSMFAYCVARLGMSEDEACRRIELARLARKFPALFAELASGQITLSVALVLKPVLSPSNHLELFAAARGKCIRQARELVVERFPKADAPSNIRKLPERRPVPVHSPAACAPVPSAPACPSLLSVAVAPLASPSSAAEPPAAPRAILPPSIPARPIPAQPIAAQPIPAPPERSSAPAAIASRSCIEPLSARRYRIQFTADADLKQKLELARDLLRHAHPHGDFAPIVSRALELLIDSLLQRRFGAGPRPSVASTTSAPVAHAHASAADSPASVQGSFPPVPVPVPASNTAATPPEVGARRARTPTSRSSHIPRAARRAVLERDGLGCSWRNAQGVRCGSHAWLELDHRQPAGKGGSSEPDNLRLLCRAHNGLAAEHAYGREHIERKATQRRKVNQRSPAG